MPIEARPDPWVTKFEQEIYGRFPAGFFGRSCHSLSEMGVADCNRQIVRNGRCVLHTPKLTLEEKKLLNPDEKAAEDALEAEFASTLLKVVQENVGRMHDLVRLEGIRFPSIPWSQPPWRELLLNKCLQLSMVVFDQPVALQMLAFASKSQITKTVFRDQANFAASMFQGIHFINTVFEGPADFTGAQWGGTSAFVQTQFQQEVDFRFSRIGGKLWFGGDKDDSIFLGKAGFARLNLMPEAELVFEYTNLSEASFLYSDLERIHLRSVRWRRSKSRWMPNSRRMLADEHSLREPGTNLASYEAVADNYRELVLSSERRRDFDAAEDFHIGEWEVKRLMYGARFKNSWIVRLARTLNEFTAYRVLSIYGTSVLSWKSV